MAQRCLQAGKARKNLLVRAEHAAKDLSQRLQLSLVLAAWRAMTWLPRRALQKKLNVVSYRAARLIYTRTLLRRVMQGLVDQCLPSMRAPRHVSWADASSSSGPLVVAEAEAQPSWFASGSPAQPSTDVLAFFAEFHETARPPGLPSPPPGLPPPAPWIGRFM